MLLRIAAKLVNICARMLLWLAAALLALAVVEAVTGSLAEAVGIPHEQALILVVGTLVLIFGLSLERGGRGRYRRR